MGSGRRLPAVCARLAAVSGTPSHLLLVAFFLFPGRADRGAPDHGQAPPWFTFPPADGPQAFWKRTVGGIPLIFVSRPMCSLGVGAVREPETAGRDTAPSRGAPEAGLTPRAPGPPAGPRGFGKPPSTRPLQPLLLRFTQVPSRSPCRKHTRVQAFYVAAISGRSTAQG